MSVGRWRFSLASQQSESSTSTVRPIGFELAQAGADDSLASTVSSTQEKKQLEAEAMRVAMSPGGGLLSTAFMLWMSGSTIQIFSIMMIGM